MATPPLLVVVLLFRSKSCLSSLSHVIQSVSNFLDSSVQLPLARASKFGSLALLNRIWDCTLDLEAGSNASWSIRSLLRSERHYKQFQFTNSLVEAVKRRDLVIIRWLFDHFPKFWIVEAVVEEAVATGDMAILRYFQENDINATSSDIPDEELERFRVVCWGGQDMAKAAENFSEAGNRGELLWLQSTEVQDLRDYDAVMRAAVINGDVDLVELVERITEIPSTREFFTAASHGHTELLEWMTERFVVSAGEIIGSLVRAAEKGDLDTVRWLIERDWNDEDLDSSDSDSDDWDGFGGGYGWGGRRRERTRPTHATNVGGEACLAIHAAAVNGHLEVAKYIRTRVDAPLNKEDEKKEDKRLGNNLKALAIRLGENHNAAKVSGDTMLLAAKRGHLDVVQWLVEEFSVDPSIDLFWGDESEKGKMYTAMDLAATNGHLEVLRYLHELGKSFKVTVKRARKRSFDSLYEFFAADDKPKKLPTTTAPKCTTEAIDGAAAHGHLDIVRWLHENRTEGCSTAAMDLASRNGHLEMVQWLHHNRSERCTTEAMDGTASGGHLDVLQWLHEHRNEGCTTKAMDGAASGGHLDIVKWLHDNRSEGCTTGAMDGAAACGALDVVKWLNQNRPEGCTTSAMDEAARKGHIPVIRWLHAPIRRVHSGSNGQCSFSWRVRSGGAATQDYKGEAC
ncbi:hypothetical protein PF007_g14218 [Phytophthora fragariae]|uniref:Ankyrin repeat domain-containing protein n=1 Tax=Phytophthora fragariae TaxID=53985 RepID=A0A6A3RVD1_9STRA|nr:hypothetical protein PF007_g14218 [Phytophthora fragariae]